MPTTIDTSTNAQATWGPPLQTVLIASDGTALVCYFDGTSLKYRSAAAPYAAWSAATTLTNSGGSHYGLSALLGAGDTVYVVYPGSGSIFYFSTLTKSGSAWTQGTPLAMSQSASAGSSGEPLALLKDSGGRLWVVYQSSTAGQWGAAYSTNNGATWTDSVTAQAMGSNIILPSAGLAGGGRYVVVVYSKNDGNLYWRRCDTTGTLTTWSAEQSTTIGTASGFGSVYYYGNYVTLAQDAAGRLVLALADGIGGFHSGVWAKPYTPGTDTWGADTHLGTNNASANPDGAGGVFAASNGTDVWALYTTGNGANNSGLAFKKWANAGATWDASATSLEPTGNNILLPNAFATTALLAFAYTQGTASPYSVEWDTFSLGGIVSGGGTLVANAAIAVSAQIVAPGTLVASATLAGAAQIVAPAALVASAVLAQPNGAQIVAPAGADVLQGNSVLQGFALQPAAIGTLTLAAALVGSVTLTAAGLGTVTLAAAVAES